MYITIAILLALQSTLCFSIRVPVVWNDNDSEVNNNDKFSVEQFQPQNFASSNQKPIPVEYFQYTAQKPKFAVDIAKFHDVQSPENQFKAYPVKPHAGVPKPELGRHQIQDKEKNIYHPFQEYVKKNEAIRTVTPSNTSYEVFHPYKLEEPALKQLYQDPVMEKIRNDLYNNKIRLQNYEKEASQPDIKKGEYLESPEETDRRKQPHKNVPAPYEIHRPQRRPVYYRPPSVQKQRDQVFNQKLRHPWHQNYVKVKPIHYQPVKNHLQRLRQQHALKYDDERNEYPSLPVSEKESEPPEGYDIYEKGKENFVKLRNNVDESLNEAVQKSRPAQTQKLELTDDEDESEEDLNTDEDEDDNFVPIKNYAQVRKTETTKHLPKEAAYHDADTLEEIQNAPRLREAVKSTKAQTVYSEEGYEDSAYDHAGEQKHASDHEAHGGFLKEKEASGGKFKAPTLSESYDKEDGSEYGDEILNDKNWKDSRKNIEKEAELEEYSDKERENLDENESYIQKPNNINNDESDVEDDTSDDSEEKDFERIRRARANHENLIINNVSSKSKHGVIKREVTIKDPKAKLNVTPFMEEGTSKVKYLKLSHGTEDINEKYPYYNNMFKEINKDSPLRYAENLKLIPKKSAGGTEFYDSRSKLQCPEVDDNIDPIPEKLKKGGHPDDNDEESEGDDNDESNEKTESSALEQTPRLRGLGDKIDCFKAKYFGDNPLDSPFFKEEIIQNPEPVTIPSIDVYKLKWQKQQSKEVSNESDIVKASPEKRKGDILTLADKPINDNAFIQLDKNKTVPLNIEFSKDRFDPSNLNDASKTVNRKRKRRAAPFVYEPYKIIRDGQIQDSKKTTTTNNISPLIKQLQSSRVADKVTTSPGKDPIVKRNVASRTYKDIGKNDREKVVESKGSQPIYDASFVDVSIDQRRGEPRYELRSINHNNEYSPEENKSSTNTKAHTENNVSVEDNSKLNNNKKPNRRRRPTTVRPFFDVSKFLPPEDVVNQPVQSRSEKSIDAKNERENYSDPKITTTTSKTKRRKDISTTIKPAVEDVSLATDIPKLRIRTRLRDSYKTETPVSPTHIETTTHAFEKDKKGAIVPKYREKKKKSRKSTLITNTNSYGEDDDDNLSKEEEVDALIGVDHDIQEYLPAYEKAARERHRSSNSESRESEKDFEDDDHNFGDDDDDEDDDDEDDDESEEDEDESEEEEEESKPELTTAEPTKRTLIKTTEAPSTTTEARSAKLKIEPFIMEKKLEIHKELPVNRSSPQVTTYKQDIQELEVIKEIPPRIKKKPQKNIEALELYKDENLAKDVNKLGGVEIFKEGLDLVNGPKHGGNYRIAETIDTDDSPPSSSQLKNNESPSKVDVVASQSKTSKQIERKDPYSRRLSDIQRARNNRNKSAKFTELSDITERPTSRSMHGGNFKSIHDIRRRGGSRNAKLIELTDETSREDHSTNKNVGNPRTYGSRGGDRHQMHGGNYRSAKLVKANDSKGDTVQTQTEASTNIRRNSADLSNSFANNVPILTTHAPYILDPSKRMYYFVDA